MADGTELFTRSWAHPDPIGTVLIIHGVSEHTGRWEHVADFFVGEGFEVHSYDQRAHGESGDGVLDIESFDHFIDDVASAVEEIRVEGRPLIIYGHSMGGLVAAMHAESDHEQADFLVLSAPALRASVPAPLKLAANVLGRFLPKFAIESPINKSQLSSDPTVGEAYVADPKVYLKGTTRFGKLFFAAIDRGREEIQKIRIPTLVVHGSDDEIVPPRASAPLAGVSGVERRVFPGLRHELHNEPESEEVLGFVSGWLKARLS